MKRVKVMTAFDRLPREILNRASLRGNEYAWRIEDIPQVINAARDANLLNIGGQLQFRLPDGGTCECYWVEVDTFKTVPVDSDWKTRVALSAETATKDFDGLREKYDFAAEGKRDFDKYLAEYDVEDAMCFVWYLRDQA